MLAGSMLQLESPCITGIKMLWAINHFMTRLIVETKVYVFYLIKNGLKRLITPQVLSEKLSLKMRFEKSWKIVVIVRQQLDYSPDEPCGLTGANPGFST